MKSKQDLLLERFEQAFRQYLKEASNPQAQYAIGYKRAQQNYYDKNLQKDFTGYSDNFKKGYTAGVKDARYGKFNAAITNILTSLGDFLGRWNVGNRSRPY